MSINEDDEKNDEEASSLIADILHRMRDATRNTPTERRVPPIQCGIL